MGEVFFLYVSLFGLLILVSLLAGSVTAFKDAAKFHRIVMAERDRLSADNEILHAELYKLRSEILELRQRLNAAEDAVASLSSQLTQ